MLEDSVQARAQGVLTVVAVVVTFNPCPQAFARQLACLLPQVERVVVVDNGSRGQCELQQSVLAHGRVQWLPLSNNAGLAFAQNRGIELALAGGASHVLLMDQDSEPHAEMVSLLLGALESLPSPSVVGPAYTDRRRCTARSPFFRLQGVSFVRLPVDDISVVHAVDHLIASGCLIPAAVLRQVGMMREDFFIDFVDIEWCLRAAHQGVGLHGVCAARMAHDLGDDPFVLWGRAFPVHGPLRHYFHVRNGVALYRQSWIPWRWRVVSAWRLVLKVGFHVLLVKPRWAHLRWAWQGLKDGWCNRLGPAP